MSLYLKFGYRHYLKIVDFIWDKNVYYRKILSLGLNREYKNCKIFKNILWTSVLNSQDINDCFTEDSIFILPLDNRVEYFVD